MPRKRKQAEQLPDPCGRRFCRFPAQWDGLNEEQLRELERAHERARCLRAGGYGSIQWDRTHGEIFNDDF